MLSTVSCQKWNYKRKFIVIYYHIFTLWFLPYLLDIRSMYELIDYTFILLVYFCNSEKPTKFLPYVFSSYFILIQVYLRNLLVVGNSRISLLLALYLFLLLNTIHNGAVKNVFNTYNCHRTLDTIQDLKFSFCIQTYLPLRLLTRLV